MRPNIALIDADILRYQCGALEMAHPFLVGEKLPADVHFVHQNVDKIINRCIEVTGCKTYRLLLTGKGNFRLDVAKQEPYKGNRSTSEKPCHYETVDRYLKSHYGHLVTTCLGYEADDEMAFQRELHKPWESPYIICSRDKDLETVPGWHYRWGCGEAQPERLPYYVSRWQAYHFFFQQMLMGDSTDNIMGCGIKEQTYWGSNKLLIDAGIVPRKVEYYLSGKNKGEAKLVTKVAAQKHVAKLLYRGLVSPFAAKVLETRFGAIQQRRRSGVGPSSALALLSGCLTVQELLEVVREQYEERFAGMDYEAIMLENARLLYMGQTPIRMFEWKWLDPFLQINKEDTDGQDGFAQSRYESTGVSEDESPL